MIDEEKIEIAYNQAIEFTRAHYENFPVISYFFSRKDKKHIAVIYQFARTADDLADEGDFNSQERIKLINEYEEKLKSAVNGKFHSDYWRALKNTIDTKKIDPKNLFDLLSAFKQDIVKDSYSNMEELEDYCKRSANPVGRIILSIFDQSNTENIKLSDNICTALQLTNFWQDVSIDILKERVYLPKDHLEKFGISRHEIESGIMSNKLKELIKFEVEYTKAKFIIGRKLVNRLKGRIKWQIKLTILGGEAILKKIEKNNYIVLNFRPRLTKLSYLKLIFKSFGKF